MLFHALQPPSNASSGRSTIRRARTPTRERAVVEERVGIGAQEPPLNHAVAAVAARAEKPQSGQACMRTIGLEYGGKAKRPGSPAVRERPAQRSRRRAGR